jgi:hypothetical protein
MAMYSDLLGVAIQAGIWGPHGHSSSSEDLLARLTDCRKQLMGQATAAAPAPLPSGVAGDLAAQMEYDLALMRLCTVLGIEYDVERFDRPDHERRRLEQVLHARGVNLAGTSIFPS